MWYVVSTPNNLDPDEEEVWECPINWLQEETIYYPPSTTKSGKKILDLIKKKASPEENWEKIKNFKIISSKDGISAFCKYIYIFFFYNLFSNILIKFLF